MGVNPASNLTILNKIIILREQLTMAHVVYPPQNLTRLDQLPAEATSFREKRSQNLQLTQKALIRKERDTFSRSHLHLHIKKAKLPFCKPSFKLSVLP